MISKLGEALSKLDIDLSDYLKEFLQMGFLSLHLAWESIQLGTRNFQILTAIDV